MILTNNPDVQKAFPDQCRFVDGNPLDVLNQAALLLDEGWHLVTAPLSPNNRLNRSPYRTVELSRLKQWEGDDGALVAKGLVHLAAQGVLRVSALSDREAADYRAIDAAHAASAHQDAALAGLLRDEPF